MIRSSIEVDGFESLVVNRKLVSMATGEGDGDSWGEFAASLMFISSPILPAVSATMADNSASSSSDEDDDELDDEVEEEDDEFEETDEDADEDMGLTSFVCNSKSLATILFSLFFLGLLFCSTTGACFLAFGVGSTVLVGDDDTALSLARLLLSLTRPEAESESDESESSLRLDVEGCFVFRLGPRWLDAPLGALVEGVVAPAGVVEAVAVGLAAVAAAGLD